MNIFIQYLNQYIYSPLYCLPCLASNEKLQITIDSAFTQHLTLYCCTLMYNYLC